MRNRSKVSLFVGLIFFSSVIYIHGQEKQRVITDLYLPKDAPVQIVGRELEGRKLVQKFDNRISDIGNSDWIKNLTLVVKNVSEKNIAFVKITLMVPQQKQMPGPLMFYFMFGSWDGTTDHGLLSPGETAKINVRESEYLSFEKQFKDWGVDSFDFAFLELRTIYFDNGTGWSLGREIIQDPLDPKKWTHVDQPKPDRRQIQR
jgi:hypothetical protein